MLERTTGLRRRLADLVDRLDALGKIDDAVASLGVLESKLDLLDAQVFRTLAHQENGTLAPGSSSVDKLFLADVYQDIFAPRSTICQTMAWTTDGYTTSWNPGRSASTPVPRRSSAT